MAKCPACKEGNYLWKCPSCNDVRCDHSCCTGTIGNKKGIPSAGRFCVTCGKSKYERLK